MRRRQRTAAECSRTRKVDTEHTHKQKQQYPKIKINNTSATAFRSSSIKIEGVDAVAGVSKKTMDSPTTPVIADENEMMLAQMPELWHSNHAERSLQHILVVGCNCDGYDRCGDCGGGPQPAAEEDEEDILTTCESCGFKGESVIVHSFGCVALCPTCSIQDGKPQCPVDWSGGACEWCDAEWEEIARDERFARSDPHPRWNALREELERRGELVMMYRCSDCGSCCCDCS